METRNISKAKTGHWLNKIDTILNRKYANPDEFKNLTEQEQTEFSQVLTQKLEELNNQHTRLLEIMGEVTQLPANRLAWENNHLKITKAINTTIFKTGEMPSPTAIAAITGLSRQTVTKHLAEGDDATIYAEQLKSFGIMAPQVLTRVMRAALAGNTSVPAMKLYFELLEKMQGKFQPPQLNQNNYIQINNTVLKQETLQQLNPDQLKQIEEIIQRNTPKA